MKLTKTVENQDYTLIDREVKNLEDTFQYLSGKSVKLDAWNVSHHHRKWEWGMALKAFEEWYLDIFTKADPKVLDVGSGDGMLGPTFALSGLGITELEPRSECHVNRSNCNLFLNPKINLLQRYDQLEPKYDAVFSISVMEHVQDDNEFLKVLADHVAPKGLLFLTTDVMPIMPAKYHFDNLRTRNFTMFDICTKIKQLEGWGFKSFGDVDLEYKGNQVYDYSFCSLCMVKQ